MKQKPDHEDLLAEVMAGEPGFREAMLGETLRLARGRRRWRQTRLAAVVLAVVGIVAVVVQHNWPHRADSQPVLATHETVHPPPAPPGIMVNPQPLPAIQVVASVKTADTVTTRPGSGGFQEINDDELLALVGAKPAVLVRRGKDASTLVFVHPEDQNGFPVN